MSINVTVNVEVLSSQAAPEFSLFVKSDKNKVVQVGESHWFCICWSFCNEYYTIKTHCYKQLPLKL